jgi:serine/threonine-protein kinase RsbT
VVVEGSRAGLAISASDQGPGIPNVADAVRDGYSTAGRLGAGLPGVKRLADEFQITSAPGRGTTVLVKRWRR